MPQSDVVRRVETRMRHYFLGPLLLGATALLAACDSNGRNGGFDLSSLTGPQSASYRCDDDKRMSVDYTGGGDRAIVDAGDRTYRLDLVDRNGRQRDYESDDATLTVDRNSAYLRVKNGSDYQDCDQIS